MRGIAFFDASRRTEQIVNSWDSCPEKKHKFHPFFSPAASPDSFADEDDYDDVSVSESDRKPPPSDEDLRSQRSKGGTGSTLLFSLHPPCG